MGSAPTKVVFICGQGRSGSTVLGNLLGELPGWSSLGEMWRLYEALEVGLGCGCGEDVESCPFWTAVRPRVAEGAPFVPEERFVDLAWRHVRIRPLRMLRMVTERPDSAPESSPLIACARIMESLYHEVADESGAHVLVDSTKGPHDAYLVEKFTDVELFLVHLVRDPRGAAFSWRRWYRTEAPDHRYQPSPRFPLGFYASRWLVRNALAEVMFRQRLGRRYVRIRYEDFAREPDQTVARICDLAGEPRQEIPGLAGGVVDFGVHHTAGGNPARMRRGPTRIEPSVGWRTEMPTREKALATLVTLPLLARYGYPIRI